MGLKIKRNTLFVRIVTIVILGIFCVSLTISYTIIKMYRKISTESYLDYQKGVFNLLDNKLYQLNDSMVKTIKTINSSRAFQDYLSKGNLTEMELHNNVYEMRKILNLISENNPNILPMLLVGQNGRTFFSTNDVLLKSNAHIWNSELTKKTIETKILSYQWIEKGFTSTTRDDRVILVSKNLDSGLGQTYAVVYFMIKEKELEKYYHSFNFEVNNVFIINNEDTIISSNKKESIGTNYKETINITEDDIDGAEKIITLNKDDNTMLIQRLSYSNLTICGTINEKKAISQIYNINKILAICTFITICSVIAIFYSVRKMTKPLSMLTKKMEEFSNDHKEMYIEVEGSSEVRELATTFNSMIDEIDRYIKEIVFIQRGKRKAEIEALQMQIKPHFIYNTLACIKYLIWQGNNEKSIMAIDSFIALLRNTVSTTDEFITFSEELDNMKNFIFINNIRYGDRINVEIYTLEEFDNYLIPKLILQPIVENCFIHGFPSEQEGNVYIMASTVGTNLRIEITDNGVGIDKERLEKIRAKKVRSNINSSGIGVSNIDDRLKLIYGDDCGIEIKSEVGKGTTIIIEIPINI